MITYNNVGFAYSINTPFEMRALYNVTTTFEPGKYYAIIGHTGSGKSTMIQQLNGLLKPTEGTLQLFDTTVTRDTKQKYIAPIRRKVGMVFQFAEQQLFEETVLKDIIFGPVNFGVSVEEATKRAYEIAMLLNLPEDVMDKSPFDLSGGQMRRVAIAGVLAMHPDIIVLDEPTAGLDPIGQREIMDLFYKLQQQTQITIILVTHQMDQTVVADEVKVMHKGILVDEGSPREIFRKDLSAYDLLPPKIVQLQRNLEEKHQMTLPRVALTVEEFSEMYTDWRRTHVR